ncbi:MAG: enoyl-CoA hydratase-related protein [Candidatus Limnocylindria bacterium]
MTASDTAGGGLLSIRRSGPSDVVAHVTLARPEVRNAFNAELIDALRSAFEALATEPPEALRGAVLAGDGTVFSAGADVEWMRASLSLSREENERDAAALADMLDAIDRCPVPVVARVQGAALGGGVGLCAVADIVIAETAAVFGFTETRLGIIPAVISPFVIRKIGQSHARALFPTGERFDAERAEAIGLVHVVVPDEAGLDAAVAAVIEDLLVAGPTAARAAKALSREVPVLEAGDARRETVARIAAQRTSPEGQEGLAAFLEHRRPAWAEGDVRET